MIETFDVAELLATTGLVPEILEFAASAAPAVKVTVFPVFATGVRMANIFGSALLEARVQVEIPEASEMEQDP